MANLRQGDKGHFAETVKQGMDLSLTRCALRSCVCVLGRRNSNTKAKREEKSTEGDFKAQMAEVRQKLRKVRSNNEIKESKLLNEEVERGGGGETGSTYCALLLGMQVICG